MAEIFAAKDAPHSSPSTNEEDGRNSTSEMRKSAETPAAAGAAPDWSPSTNQEEARNSTSQMRKPPVISLAMLRRAIGDEIAFLKPTDASDRVYAGVLLKDDKKQGEAKKGEDQEQPYTHKYWVDRDLNKSCWMVLAKALQISYGDLGSCGDLNSPLRWPQEEEACCSGNIKLPVAELADVPWVDIRGKCKSIMLAPRTTYVVKIIVKTGDEKNEWGIPVKLSLELPDGNKQGRIARLKRLEKWTPIMIGKFNTTPKTIGEIRFSLAHFHEKSCLLVKGVVFMPT